MFNNITNSIFKTDTFNHFQGYVIKGHHVPLEIFLITQTELAKKFSDLTKGKFKFPLKIDVNITLPKNSTIKQILFDLDEPSKLYGLTALHVAVINKNTPALELLLEAGANPNSLDRRKWTPLHHAAASGEIRMFELLQKYGAKVDLRNDLYGTPANLLRMVTCEKNPPKEVPYTYFDGKDHLPLDAKKFTELTGATYIDSNCASPSLLLNEWIEAPDNYFRSQKFAEFAKDLDKLEKEPKKFYLKKVGCTGHGAFAKEKIKSGEVFATYLGDLIERDKCEDPEYLLGDIDGKKRRNILPLANDGFPNASFVFIRNYGLKGFSFAIACEDIEPHSEILVDYRTSYIKRFGHYEPRYEEAKEFLLRNPLPKLLKIFDQYKNMDIFDAYLNEIVKMSYIVHTPATALNLMLDEAMDCKDFLQIRKQSMFQGTGFADEFVPIMQKFFINYAKMSIETKKLFRDCFKPYLNSGKDIVIMNFLKQDSAVNLYKEMDLADCFFFEMAKGAINSLLEELDKKIENYIKNMKK